jgi:predicted LPLAT superfamily acyltransferase
MAVTYYFKSRHDGIVSCQVEMDAGRVWFRFTRLLTAEEKSLLAVTAQVGTLEAVRALKLPFWDVISQGGPSWYHR